MKLAAFCVAAIVSLAVLGMAGCGNTPTSAGGGANAPAGTRRDLSGCWKFADGEAKLFLQQSISLLTGHFESGDGTQRWKVEGRVSDNGQVELNRLIPISEWPNVPEPAL